MNTDVIRNAIELLEEMAQDENRDVEVQSFGLACADVAKRLTDLITQEFATFDEAWKRMEAKGYQYGGDALEQVRFGWELRGKAEQCPAQLMPDDPQCPYDNACPVHHVKSLERALIALEKLRDVWRAALEELSDGVCHSKFGPGCDDACKARAYKALGDEKPE